MIRNYQVIHLSEASFRGQSILDAEALQSDLQSARSLLDGWGYAGLVEDYEASAVHYESQYRADFPGLILADQWHNKTSSQSVDQALQAAEAELGPARLSRFEQANALDYALWSWARDRFHR